MFFFFGDINSIVIWIDYVVIILLNVWIIMFGKLVWIILVMRFV